MDTRPHRLAKNFAAADVHGRVFSNAEMPFSVVAHFFEQLQKDQALARSGAKSAKKRGQNRQSMMVRRAGRGAPRGADPRAGRVGAVRTRAGYHACFVEGILDGAR